MTEPNPLHRIDTFSLTEAAEAEEYAASIGATTETVPYDPARFGGGYISIIHPNAEGITVTRWNGIKLRKPCKLIRRDSLQPLDVVISSYTGGETQAVEVLYDGKENGFFRYPNDRLEAGAAASLIPLVSRVASPAAE
jgi:hypothetical protein